MFSDVVLKIPFLFVQENIFTLYTATQIFNDFFVWWDIGKKNRNHERDIALCHDLELLGR